MVEGDESMDDDAADHPNRSHHHPGTPASEDEGTTTDRSDGATLDTNQQPPKKRKRTSKANESMQQTVDRITRFMRAPVSSLL